MVENNCDYVEDVVKALFVFSKLPRVEEFGALRGTADVVAEKVGAGGGFEELCEVFCGVGA